MNKCQISVYIQLWEYCLEQGLKTIKIIEEENAWEFRTYPHEYTVKETFYHAVQAIYEDAGRWFLDEFKKYKPKGSPSEDLRNSINRMIGTFRNFSDDELKNEMTFQWGKRTTIAKAIQQNLFHAVGHFSQVRNWVGISKRLHGKGTRGDIV